MPDSNDIIYGDYDLSVRLNVESGLGDEENPDLHTGEIWVWNQMWNDMTTKKRVSSIHVYSMLCLYSKCRNLMGGIACGPCRMMALS